MIVFKLVFKLNLYILNISFFFLRKIKKMLLYYETKYLKRYMKYMNFFF